MVSQPNVSQRQRVMVNKSSARRMAFDEDEQNSEEADFRPLTREQALRLRQENPSMSVWRVLAWQAGAGVLVALLAFAFTGKSHLAWSVLYGALAVVVPAALFAHGLTGKLASINPGTAVAGFFLWELVKISLTIAMMFAAPRVVENLSWPAMLVGLIVTMKVSWVALMSAARR